MSRGLVALGSAAVLTIYTAGYARTRMAAERLDAAERPRPVVPAPAPESAPAHAPTARVEPAPAAPSDASSMRREHTAGPHSHDAAPHTHDAARRANAPLPAAGDSSSAPTASPVVEAPPPPVPTPAATPTPTPVETLAATPASKWIDGSFSGWGRSRHGDIQATVAIENGKIVYVAISICDTRYPCDVIAKLPGQVLARQSPETDFVAGATESTNAFYYAVVEALKKATR